jgi:predicted amidohydrolase
MAGFGIDHVVDVALAPERDRLGLVAGNRLDIAHAGTGFQNFRMGWANSTNSKPLVPAGLSSEILARGASWGNGPIVSLLVLSALLMLAAALVD